MIPQPETGDARLLYPLDATVTDAALTPEERSARESQTLITSAIRRTALDDDPIRGEFRVGYDQESALTALDFGGEDQEKRHATS
jgi:hypothetical protein